MDESIDRSQLSDPEYEILMQYQLTLAQLKNINTRLENLNRSPTPQLIENLRFLENKIGLLFTLIKSSAFSFIVKHQQDINMEDGNDDEEEEDDDDVGKGGHARKKLKRNNGQEGVGNESSSMVNGILQSLDGTVNVTLDSTR